MGREYVFVLLPSLCSITLLPAVFCSWQRGQGRTALVGTWRIRPDYKWETDHKPCFAGVGTLEARRRRTGGLGCAVARTSCTGMEWSHYLSKSGSSNSALLCLEYNVLLSGQVPLLQLCSTCLILQFLCICLKHMPICGGEICPH